MVHGISHNRTRLRKNRRVKHYCLHADSGKRIYAYRNGIGGYDKNGVREADRRGNLCNRRQFAGDVRYVTYIIDMLCDALSYQKTQRRVNSTKPDKRTGGR